MALCARRRCGLSPLKSTFWSWKVQNAHVVVGFLVLLLVSGVWWISQVPTGPEPSRGVRHPWNRPCPGRSSKRCRGDNNAIWSIGLARIPAGQGPLAREAHIDGPVLTGGDVHDVRAVFQADPFLLEVGHELYIFSEVLDADAQEGVIGLAVSTDDGFTFHHLGIVLREPYHLSFPFVVQEGGAWYMTVCATAGSPHPHEVWLYSAPSPRGPWARHTKLLHDATKGHAIDPVLHADGQGGWFLLAQDSGAGVERAWWAPAIVGPFRLVKTAGKPSIRQSGRLLPAPGGGLWSLHHTGTTVTAHKLSLSRTLHEYPESLEEGTIVLRPFPAAPHWRFTGMHTYSALQRQDGSWLAAVDGWWDDAGLSVFKCLEAGRHSAQCQQPANPANAHQHNKKG